MKLYIDLHYFPCIPYWQEIGRAEEVYLGVGRPFQKQSYQTRCHIRNAQGMQRLIIPTCHPRSGLAYREIRIDYGTNWMRQHWRSITVAYHMTPYGEVLDELFRPFFEARPRYLIDLTLPLLKKGLDFLQLSPRIYLHERVLAPRNAIDLYGFFHPKRPCGDERKGLMYAQRFAPPFVRDLSILDLMACEGREGLCVEK